MKTLDYRLLSIILLGFFSLTKGLVNESIAGGQEPNYQLQCNKLAKRPFFEPDMVTGKPWRIYYVWNMNLGDKCVDIQFTFATPKIIRRIYNDMNEYVEEQPAWGAASLLMHMGKSLREILLFVDQGPVGTVLGVPNTVRDGSLTPIKMTVPLLRLFLKMIDNNNYLILMDCQVGIASLAARLDETTPTNVEVYAVARTLFPILGVGDTACLHHRLKSDDFLVP